MLNVLGYLFGLVFFTLLIVLMFYILIHMIQKTIAKGKFFKQEIEEMKIELEAKSLLRKEEKERLRKKVNILKRENMISEETKKVLSGEFAKG